ncbi:rna-directed dna polymerase from mobile element jockey- hypothetical protein [Limosa lapponica baueri]|uniref:Reverse transcriptase domain-containing protein n=1 Tax=Limosa lapponica baueri TaxID=1758121 RepID=A0A2I0TU69_LIMLA|nr:rna-directed dna polymerase from mobile element jockey- hypothetical protein [Limosa lapponica baueri]
MTSSGRSWQLDEIPGDCKNANIPPAFQKDKKENSGNNKPVSLTSTPERVIEQLLMEAIFTYIIDKMIRSCQLGYNQGKSCLTNLVAACDETTGFADERREWMLFILTLARLLTLSPISSASTN